jgi:hypothetical protein
MRNKTFYVKETILPPLSSNLSPLSGGGLRALLSKLGAPDAFGNPPPAYTGRIVIEEKERSGWVYFRSGRIYAVGYAGFTPPIAVRLQAGGLITLEQYNYLKTLPPQLVGIEAVTRNYVAFDSVEDINRQMMLSSLTFLYGWKEALWRWEEGVETDSFIVTGLEANLVISAADERISQWDTLVRNFPQVTKSKAVPFPGEEWHSIETASLTPDMASLLQYVNGETSIARIATACGFTRFEIAARLAKAISQGLIFLSDPDTGEKVGKDYMGETEKRAEEYKQALYAFQIAEKAYEVAKANLARLENK